MITKPKTIFGKHYHQPLKQFIINGIIGATRLKTVRVVQSLDLAALMLLTRDICENSKIAKLLNVQYLCLEASSILAEIEVLKS